jgi:hypothetical protein
MNLICRRRVLARTESETTVHQWSLSTRNKALAARTEIA